MKDEKKKEKWAIPNLFCCIFFGVIVAIYEEPTRSLLEIVKVAAALSFFALFPTATIHVIYTQQWDEDNKLTSTIKMVAAVAICVIVSVVLFKP